MSCAQGGDPLVEGGGDAPQVGGEQGGGPVHAVEAAFDELAEPVDGAGPLGDGGGDPLG